MPPPKGGSAVLDQPDRPRSVNRRGTLAGPAPARSPRDTRVAGGRRKKVSDVSPDARGIIDVPAPLRPGAVPPIIALSHGSVNCAGRRLFGLRRRARGRNRL